MLNNSIDKIGVALALGMLCSCSKPLPPGTYTVKTTVLSQTNDRVVRQYEIETTGRRELCLRSASGVDSSGLGPDAITKESTGKAEALLTITKQATSPDTSQAVLEMVVKTSRATSRCKRELPVPADANLTTLVSDTIVDGSPPLTNTTTLLRLASGDRWLELSVE
jgi:hypothetical protein